MSLSLNSLRILTRRSFSVKTYLAAGDGSGIGHGGGSGGTIRDAGGSFGEREAAFENQYFKKLEAEQLESLRKRHDEEIKRHEEEIKRLQNSINEHKKLKESFNK